ncbi:MAG: inositol monophosphatase family protein [Burkholderiales bacterium]
MHPLVNTAVKAARRAGAIIERASQNLDLIAVQKKSRNDFVSEVDRAAEAAIIEILLNAYPEHEILAEESGSTGRSEYQWVIDPLDGTTNFLHGFPQYAVSIALVHKGQIAHGVIYDPTRNDLFTASRGRGAFLNERRMRVSRRHALEDALIGTGFPFRETARLERYLAMFRDITLKTSGVRRPGSAALDLAYVAAGRYDGFWEMGLHAWDMAAGALMILEAGGLVSDLAGNQEWLETGDIVAGNPKIFVQLLKTLAPYQRTEDRGQRTEAED